MDLRLPLERQLVSIMAANREDSYATQRKRGYILMRVARELHARFGLQKWDNLGQKHVQAVIECFRDEDTGRRSIEEKLTHLRWLVKKIGKANLVPRTNRELGIEPGPRHTRAGKAIPDEVLAACRARLQDARIQAMVGFARAWGLRCEEASLVRPHRDFDGTRLEVKRGAKGGRFRYIRLRTAAQVAAIEKARALTRRDGALIGSEFRTFEEWRQYVYRQLRAAGFSRAADRTFHDIRRTYIIERMRGLLDAGITRWVAAGLVAREAGHHRTEVLAWYLESEEADKAA